MKGRPALRQGLAKYHAAVHDLFAAYGSFVAAHPLPPLLLGVLILGSLSIGIVRVKEEIDIENLWVERNSRIIPEKQFFDSRFGGIPREETAAITMKTYPDDKFHDLRLAMDALTSAIKPLYDELSLKYTTDSHVEVELKPTDFCERPFIPKTLRSGSGDPNKLGNWYAWGYRRISTCALNSIKTLYPINITEYKLPDDWGLDVLPCNKLSPMDCFQEGKDLDYPEALQQLEKLVILNGTLNATLNQAVAGFEKFTNNLCSSQLESALKDDPESIGVAASLSPEQISNILAGIKTVVNVFAGWGYNWRRSYKSMSNEEILDYFSKAIEFSKNTSIDWRNPAVSYCITENRPCCLTWFGGSVPMEASFGGIEYDRSDNISAIASLRWGSDHWNHKHPLWMEYISNRLNMSLSDEQRKSLVLSWENLMVEHLTPLYANAIGTNFTSGAAFEDYQIQFTIWRSTEDLLQDANSVPIWQIIFSVILVFSYAFFSFINVRNPVHSHTWLVLTGMIVVSFAIVAGFGLTSIIGIKLSPLAGSVVPFLALGLGIDDVFVLVNMLRNYLAVQGADNARLSVPENEMRLVISHAGPSVVLTTFSVLASFFISSVTPMPIVRWFCWQMGITAVIHTCGMLLIFIPLMSLDARRVKSSIVDPSLWLFCGIRQPNEGVKQSDSSEVNGSASQEYRASSSISLAIAKYYAPLFQHNIFKIIVMLLFAVLLSISIYFSFWKVEHGLRLSDIALKGSYQHDYARLVEDIYPQYNLFLVTQNVDDYSTAQTELLEVFNRPESNLSNFLLSSSKIVDFSWMANLYSTVNLTWSLSYPVPTQNFSQLAQSWSSSPLGVFSLQDIYCESMSTKQQKSCFAEEGTMDWKIGATKTLVLATSVGSDTHNNIEMIKQTRRTLDNLNEVYFNGTKVLYMYGYSYLFNEQYLHSSHDLYMVVGFALVGVFVAVFIFQFSIMVSLVIAILLLMVDIEVYGFLYVLGAKLNALSLVNLGIVIGMASEFTYLARSFLLFDGTKNERVQKALEWTFEPLLHGLGTQVVATLPLLFLKYHAFRVYYFGMFTMMGVLAFLNGFVLLPTVLSWIGPPSIARVADDVNHSSTAYPQPNLTHNAVYGGDAHNNKEQK